MSATDSNGYFIELGEHCLILARTNLAQRPRVVDDLREAWLGDPAAVEAALSQIKAGATGGRAVALLRLKTRGTFVSDAASAKKVASAAAVEEFLRENLGAENTPANWSWASLRDGRPPENGAPWVLDAVPQTNTDEALTKLKGWSFEMLRCQSASLALSGALSTAARSAQLSAPLLLCDVAETRSFLFAISGQGISAFTSIPVGFDALAGSTQTALGLKFRGSASRLLFNESYDFADSAAKILEPLVVAIRENLGSLGSVAPSHFVCSGILAKQAWMSQTLSSELGLKPFTADVGAWAGAHGLTLGTAINAAAVSPTWLGILSAIAAYDPRNPGAVTPWHPVLTNTPVASAPVVSAIIQEPVAPVPKPAVVTPPAPKAPEPAAKPNPPVAAKPAVVITPPAKAPEPSKPAVVTPPVKAAATPAPKAPEPKPAQKAPDPKAVAPKPAPVPTPAQKAPAKPEPAKPTPPPAKAAPTPVAVQPVRMPAAKKSSSMPIIIGVVALILLGGGGFLFYQSGQKEKAKQAQVEKDLQDRAAKEAADRRASDERLKAETDARKKAEADAAQRAIAAELARKKSEEDARASTTERLLNARGGLNVATDPAGATVVVGELAPRPSPISLKDLRLGRYSVSITHPGYDSEQRDVEIKEGEPADLGTIKLKRQVGSVSITSDPSGLPYELKPAGSLFVNPSDVKSGQTPATLNDIPAGSYQITIVREGWVNYVSTVNVERNGAAKVQGAFPGGTVTLTSNPPGATVMKDNQTQVGVTPLTLNDITPGNVSYTLTMRGFDPITVTGRVESSKMLALSGTMLDSDRVMKQTELDERPFPVSEASPELSSQQQLDGGTAVISLVVGKDGLPTDLKILQATSPALGRACLVAASKWKFKPGTIRGKPVRSTVTIPFKMTPGS